MRMDRIIAILLTVICSALLVRADGINVQYSLKSKAFTFAVDLTTTGNQSVTGIGFTPTSCIISGAIGGSGAYGMILGVADSAGTTQNVGIGTAILFDSTAWFRAVDGPAFTNVMTATWVSWDADGFTFSKAKTASPTGTWNGHGICFR